MTDSEHPRAGLFRFLRASWRDPNLRVIRDYRMADGSRMTEVDPDYERRYRAYQMESAPHPRWQDDPTYHGRRK